MFLNCNEVLEDKLWVGAFIQLQDVRQLRQIGITHIISLQSDDDIKNYKIPLKKIVQACEEADIRLQRVPIPDFSEDAVSKGLERAVSAMESAMAPRWTKVYLHCSAGINRAPTVTAAYLMRSRHLSALHAYDFITARRHCQPYLSVLEKFEAALSCCE